MARELARLDLELDLAQGLGSAGHAIFAGVTSEATRKEGFRAAILATGCQDKPCGKIALPKLSRTFSETFEALYGESL